MKLYSLAIAIAGLVFSTAPLCQADPVVLNGSFEVPMNPPSGISPGGGAPSWMDMGPSVFILSNSFGGPQTIFGTQYLGIAMHGSSDQQTIPGFSTGQGYVLDLFISNIFNSAGPQLTVTITGAATATGSFNAAPADGFSEVQLPFSATNDGSIVLSLIDTGIGNSTIAVDNVSIETLPEPSTMFAMLLLSGTLTLGAARRIRRSRAP